MPRPVFLLRFALLALLSALAGGLATAQPAESGATGEAEERLHINMRDADIRAVIQWIAEQTHKQIVIDPRVRGRITVLADQPMSVDQAYEVFLAALEVYGFGAAESGGILRIVPGNLLQGGPRDVVREFEQLHTGQQVVHVVNLRNVSASHAQALIEPLVAARGAAIAFPGSNALLLADDGAQVKRLVELLRMIDSESPVNLEVVKLRYADARKAADVVASLFPAGAERGGELPISISADERSNSVLLAGDPLRRRQVIDLLERIDRPLDSSGSTRVVYLNYLSARELVPVLQGMASSAQKDSRDQQVLGTEISIEASESTNALVLTGPPNLIQRLVDVVDQLDIRRAQVLVEAIIVEVSQELVQSLGVEWNTSLNGNGLEAATRFGLRAGDPGSVAELLGPGLSLGFYRNGSLRALLNALATTTDANILSTPSVITLDNQEAQILVGSNIPIITGQSTGSASSTENPFTVFERQDIGVTLKITPQINQGDAITLDILQEVESLAETAGQARDVVTNKRSIATKVLVEDDAVLVLGGLISDERRQRVDKVPLLGDLPLVGALFRTTTDQYLKRNLMVFIHPLILTDPSIAEEQSRQRYRNIRSQQLRFEDDQEITREPPILPGFDSRRRGQPVHELPEYETITPASDIR